MSHLPAGRYTNGWTKRTNWSIVAKDNQSDCIVYWKLTASQSIVADAHFTLLVPICMVKLCNFQPMAAMHLVLDFGHDTDSYAQVLGGIAGAVHGPRIFAPEMIAAVKNTLRADNDERVEQWLEVLRASSATETLDEQRTKRQAKPTVSCPVVHCQRLPLLNCFGFHSFS